MDLWHHHAAELPVVRRPEWLYLLAEKKWQLTLCKFVIDEHKPHP